jgi:hypothetical protein
MDYSAGRALKELQQDLSRVGVVLALIVIPVRHQSNLERLGLVDLIGANRIFQSRHACIHAYRLEAREEDKSSSQLLEAK